MVYLQKHDGSIEKLSKHEDTDWSKCQVKDGFIWGAGKYWKNSTIRPGIYLLDLLQFTSSTYIDDNRYIWIE